MQKIKDNLTYYFIILLPFIDFITGICTWNNINFSLGLILRGLFLLYVIFYLLKNYPNKKIFLFLGLYFVIYFLYLLTNKMNLVTEITSTIKIFYLPILILFFNSYNNININKKTISIIFFFYLLLYLIPIFLGLGHNINELYANKELYLSYFYIGNELVNIFIILLPITILYLKESNCYILKGLFIFLIILTSLLLSTKVYYGGLFLILFYFAFINRRRLMNIYKNNQLKVLVSIAVILVGIIIYIPKIDLYNNIKTQLDHYEVTSIKDIIKIDNIDHIIFSSRLTFFENVKENYIESTSLEKLLGIGREKLENINLVEIDVADIFYSLGLVGISFYLIFFIYVLKQTKLKGSYKFTFILLIIISCLSGHVLLSPMVSTILSLLFIVSNNDNGKSTKNILLVSNMYPSKSSPHYGIFVKNTYDLLLDNGYSVDKVIMYKTDNKLKKVFNYIRFYIESFFKSLWNNYDYIYVHFISHSTFGILLPYRFSKNTKLVLNVHGNDIIADSDNELKNEIKSYRYLAYADKVITPSIYFKNLLKEKYHVKESKIIIYPSGGVDINKFHKINKKIALKNASLKDDIKYFGYISRIEKDKGYDTLILAINELKKHKKLNNIKFLIIGNGSEENILDELILKYKLKKYIERRPFATQDELVNIYNSLTALVYPTRRKSESLGLTGLEALACETLVIGSNKYGPSDYLINNENSITFNPEDYHELTLKIEESLKLKVKERNRLTKNGREKALKYSLENTKDNLLNVFKK